MSAGTATERALTFDCAGDTLVGILHEPAAAADVGVIMIVGGPQYRAGSHRQFVLLARAVADAGFAVLRFDCRGMGDSEGAPRSFENTRIDVGAAISVLQAQAPAVHSAVLWGLCDGASAALLYLDAVRDRRVVGLALLNPWVRSESSLARTHLKHYYMKRLRERAFWQKLLSGGIGTSAWRGWLGNVGAMIASTLREDDSFQARMARAWAAFEGHVLLVLSGNDLTAQEFADAFGAGGAWAAPLRHPRFTRCELDRADHTFSTSEWRGRVAEATIQWLQGVALATAPVARTLA